MNNYHLSIIIPAYNEALRIGPTLQAILDYLANKNFTHEIIVVDDGSKDATVSVVEKFRNIFKNIKLLKNDKNKGKGYSVRRGMLVASGEHRLFMDADHSVKIDNLDKFLKHSVREYSTEGSDIIIASIELPGSSILDDNHGYRRILGRLSKILIRHVATTGIYDTQRGFKLFNARATEIIFPRQTINRWGFDIELLVIARKKGLKIKEVPVEWINGKTSSVGIGSYIMTLWELLCIKVNSWKGKYN